MNYLQMTKEELDAEKKQLDAQYEVLKARGLALDLSRGKPGKNQLDTVMDMLTCVKDMDDCYSETGLDCRNYGVLDGIPEVKRLFAELLDLNEIFMD